MDNKSEKKTTVENQGGAHMVVESESPTVQGIGPEIAKPRESTNKKVVFIGENISPRSRITKEMCIRAVEDQVPPHQWLLALAYDENLRFTDWVYDKDNHEWLPVERGATLEERRQCARDVLPFFVAKKVEVKHEGQVEMLHSLMQSPLDAIELDDDGQVIDDADLIDGEIDE